MKRKIFSILFTLVLVLSLSLVTAVPASAAPTLYEHYNTGDDATTSTMHSTYWIAQTFTAESYHSITSVKLKLGKTGNPGMITVSIRDTDGSGHPIGSDLTSGTTDGDTLPTTSPWEWREIGLTSYLLTSGTKYAIVVRTGGDASNGFRWRFDSAPGGYPGGNYEYSANSGSTWTSPADSDYMFEVHGPSPPIEVWVDDAWVGCSLGGPADGHTCGITGFGTIQDGIDAVATGGTVNVAAGTYTEDLVIPAAKSNLELVGATGATIKGVDTLAWTNWPLPDPNIDILASGVKIHGFTIESPDVPDTDYSSGVVLDGTNIEIYDNEFVSTGTGGAGCVVIQTYRDNVLGYNSDISGLDIHDNDFSGTLSGGWVGVFINHTLTGTGTVTVQDNDFSGTPYQGVVTERDNTVISGNSIITDMSATGYGIIVMDWDARPQDNVQITGNTVKGSSGFAKGIQIGNSAGTQTLTNISVINNTVQGNDVGIKVRSSANGVVVNFNNINGNTTYGVENTDSNTLDATNNWWDDASGPGGVGPGTGDSVSANVDYSPWLGAPVVVPSLCCQTLVGTGPHEVDAIAEADTEATLSLSSETDIFIVKYESQPFPEEPFPDETLGKFIDVYLSNPAAVVWPIYVEVHYTDGEVRAAGIAEGSLGLYYYMSPDTFHRCSDTGVDTTNNIIWANVTAAEASYLVGTPFGGGGNPRIVGGTVLPVDKLSILMPWIGLAVALALAGVFIARFARRKVRS